MVRNLLQKGADPNYTEPIKDLPSLASDWITTPILSVLTQCLYLMNTMKWGIEAKTHIDTLADILELLLRHGADANMSCSGMAPGTSFHYALLIGRSYLFPIMNILLYLQTVHFLFSLFATKVSILQLHNLEVEFSLNSGEILVMFYIHLF